MSYKTTKAANGNGSIRKRTRKRANGTSYTYWEGRVTTGYDSETGKQTQKTITGKTQKEVSDKIKKFTYELDNGNHVESVKMTVAQWLDEWQENYLVNVKASTAYAYKRDVELYIEPGLGKVQLQKLTKTMVQAWIKKLVDKELSSKTIKDIVGVLHKAMEDAMESGMISKNPAHKCKRPKVTSPQINHLENEDIERFLVAIQGHVHERLYKVALFTGLRENEILGLTWDCVDFQKNEIAVTKQLCRERCKGGKYYFAPPKDNEERVLVVAPTVMKLLKEQQMHELEKQAAVGAVWENKNMVFSNPTGGYLSYRTVYDCYKRITKQLGLNVRFHDLRHAYTALSLQAGDDIKTVQDNLGHATADFTLKVYAYTNKKMKQDSANRMEAMIQGIAI